MSEVIDKIREKYPDAYKDVDDSELALRVGSKFPTYLDQDPDFKNEFTKAAGQRSLDLALKGTGEVLKIITNPAVGEASEMGRQQAEAERVGFAVQTGAALPGIITGMIARGSLAAPTPQELEAQKKATKEQEDFQKLGPSQQLSRARMASAGAAGEGLKQIATTPLIHLDLTPEKIFESSRQFMAAQLGVNPDVIGPKATKEQVESAMKKSPVLAASVGTAQAISQIDEFFTSPLGIATLGIGALPATAQRFISLGFAAQMASQTPEIASELGTEVGKPPAERDYQKIGSLVTSGIANTGFTIAGVFHAAEPAIAKAREKQEFKAALSQMPPSAPATTKALEQQVNLEPEPVTVSAAHEAVGVVKREKIGAKDRITLKTQTGEEIFEGSPKAIDAILANMAAKTAEKPSQAPEATKAPSETETPASAQAAEAGTPIEKGAQDASEVGKAAEVYGDLRTRAGEGPREVPVTQGGPGIQPQAEGRIPETPKPEASAEQDVGQKIDRVTATDAEGFKKHVDDLRASGSSMQQDAHRTGASITTPAELEKVKAARANIESQVKTLKEQIKTAKPEDKPVLLEQFAATSQKGQWFNEVLEGALGSKDATKMAIIKKDVGPDYKPPMQVVKGEEIPTAQQIDKAAEKQSRSSDLPKLVIDTLTRSDHDADWVWMHATPEEKAEIDSWVVSNKHPSATEPGTAEGRFKRLVKENLSPEAPKAPETPRAPEAAEAPTKAAPAAEKKYRIGDNPTLYSILERLPQSEAEKANNEQPVRVRNENTGKEETVMESDLKLVKERTAAEKAKAKGEKRDLDQELRELGMDPSVFKTKQDKQAAIIREHQKKQGPGTPHITQPPDPKANITALEESFRNVRGREVPISERVKAMFDLGERIAAARDKVTQGIAGLKTTGDYLIDKWKDVHRLDDFLKAVGALSAEIEKNSWRMKQFVKTIERNVPDKMDRAAIRKWVDAGGNMESLIAGFEEAPPEYKQHYLDAMDLSGDLLVGAMNIRNYFEARLQEAIDSGVLKEGVEDYIHRLYERNPEAQQRMLAYVQSGLLKTNPALIKKRIFDHDWEAERLGFRPVQDFLPAITTYESSLTRAIAAREFIRKITGYEDSNGNKVPGMLAADGRPVIDAAGLGIPLEDQNGVPEGTLIKPSGLAKGKSKINPVTQEPEVDPLSVRNDYVIRREYPAFRNWKWVANDTAGNSIFVHGDLAIHPDFVHRFDDLLKPSQVRYNPRPVVRAIGRAALGVSSFAKQSLLDLSMFHQVQIEVHAAEHRVYAGPGPSPPGMTKVFSEINVDDPKMDRLLRGGLIIGGDYIYDPYYSEGLLGRSISRAIPGLKEVMEAYHQKLFQDIIPRIKATMAYEALDRNIERYQKELDAGTMTMEDIDRLTATQANAAFGGLNYRMLERSKTMQDLARIVLLAPDFLEARTRFTAQSIKAGAGDIHDPEYWKKGGPLKNNEQRVAMLLGAITMWSLARVGNMLISGQPHNEPDNLFSVVIKGKSWGLRTVQGDILHLAEHPIQFWMSRLNPVFGRTLLEAATGRDYFGRKRNSLQQVWDAASTLIPASVRFSNERSIWEALANSMGVTARRFSDVDDAFKLAQKWKDTHGVGMKGEFIYDPNKDDLRGLKVALSNTDEAGAARELRRLLDSKKYTIPKINAYFDRYGNMPFTGSEKNDREWMKTLSDDEKKTVEAARDHKKAMRKLWHDIRDKYLQAQQHPEQLNEGQESETDTNAPALVQ